MRELQNNSAHSWACHRASWAVITVGFQVRRAAGGLTHGELGKELETTEPLEAE